MTEISLSPVELLIFQGTPFCNIECRYCYLPDRNNRSRISIETVVRTCDLLARDSLVADAVEVLWHAGEPLIMPVDFYDRAFASIERHLGGPTITHKIQTNATLIDDEWIELFKHWNVLVGLSLDGPPHIHDRYRTTRAQGPTSKKVHQAITKLHEAGLGLHVICVLTRDSIAKPDELFEFFEGLGVDTIGFNIDEAEGPHVVSSHQSSGSPRSEFRVFLLRYFERVISTNSKQSVRELKRGLNNIFQKQHRSSYETLPIRVLTVGHNGDFGTFSPELFGLQHSEFGQLVFGNVSDPIAFRTLGANPRLLAVYDSIRRGIEACSKCCSYFEVCRGGVPSNKLGEYGTFETTETIACQFRVKAVTDAAVELILGKKLGNV